jgi:hypothetical protein
MAGGTWLVDPLAGDVHHITSGVEADVLESEGWKAFTTEAAAQAYAKESDPEKVAGEITSPVTSALNATGDLGDLGDAVKYLAATTDWIGNRKNIIRIVKVLLGAGLIFMGIQQLRIIQRGESLVINTVGKAAETAAIV